MDDIESIIGIMDDLPAMNDEVVNIYLMSGDTIPVQNQDSGRLFNQLRLSGHTTIRDGRGTVVHLFRHGVAGVAGFSKQTVDEAREVMEELKRRMGGES